MERQPSAARLILSLLGVNLLIAGLCVVLVPHYLVGRLARLARRRTPPTIAARAAATLPRTALPRTALGR